MSQRYHPETNEPMTDHQWQAAARDAKVRVGEAAGALNDAIKKAADYDVKTTLAVDEIDESHKEVDVRRMPAVVAGRIAKQVPGKKYPQVRTIPSKD